MEYDYLVCLLSTVRFNLGSQFYTVYLFLYFIDYTVTFETSSHNYRRIKIMSYIIPFSLQYLE